MQVNISIIMAAYQAASFLGRAIASVQSQTRTDWELIVIDDASVDGTAAVAEALARDDSRIRILRRGSNGGPGQSRNDGIAAARGRFIAFLDADDAWLPKKLELQVDFQERTGAPLTYTAYDRVAESGRLIGSVRVPPSVNYRSLLGGSSIGCLTAMYDSKVLGKVYMPLIRKRQDLGLWLSITRNGDLALGLDVSLARYTVRRSSVSAQKIQAARYQWRLYRQVERLGIMKSAGFFTAYAAVGVGRRLREMASPPRTAR